MSKQKTDFPLDILTAIQETHTAVKELIGNDPLFSIEIFDQDNFKVHHDPSNFSFQVHVIKNRNTHKLDFHITRSPHSFSKVEEQSVVAPSVGVSTETFEN
jgi:hypothetical protein